jgi:hypothetical protein
MQFTLFALLASLVSVSVSAAPAPALQSRGGAAENLLNELNGVGGNHVVVKKDKGFTVTSDCGFINQHDSGDFQVSAFDCGGTVLTNGADGGFDNWAFTGNYDEIRDDKNALRGAIFKAPNAKRALNVRGGAAEDLLSNLNGIAGNHVVVKSGKGFTVNSDCPFTNDHISGDFHLFAFECGGTVLTNGADGGFDNWAFTGNYDEIRDDKNALRGVTFKAGPQARGLQARNAGDSLANLNGVPGNHAVVKVGKGFTVNADCPWTNEYVSGDYHFFAFECGGTILRNGADGGFENWAFNGNYEEIRNDKNELMGAKFS